MRGLHLVDSLRRLEPETRRRIVSRVHSRGLRVPQKVPVKDHHYRHWFQYSSIHFWNEFCGTAID
jgi:hypothetical protein